MMILNYFKKYFRRRKARRITREYPEKMESFNLEKEGRIDFANWDNPLSPRMDITQGRIDFFKKFIKKGDLIIDIGANFGDTTVLMALAAGSTGTTLGFEPNPFAFKILKKNAGLNSDKINIIPLPYAITMREEEFYYISSEASFANGGISKTKESRHGKFIYPDKIKGINLIEFLENNYPEKINKLSFIKIDTEGYDKEIIKSIPDLIEKYKPVLVAESFGKSSADDKKELFDVISRHNYEIYYFEDFDINARIIKLESGSDLSKYEKTINIYATPSFRN